MLIPHKGHTDTIQVYSVTVMTHVKALQAGHSSQGTSEPITPGLWRDGRYKLERAEKWGERCQSLACSGAMYLPSLIALL